jgi:hypothetical protein
MRRHIEYNDVILLVVEIEYHGAITFMPINDEKAM